MPHMQPGARRNWSQSDRGLSVEYQAATVQVGLHAPGIVRYRLAPGGAFSPRRPWSVVPPDDAFPPLPQTVEPHGDRLRIAQDDLTVELGPEGTLAVHHLGRPLALLDDAPRWGEVEPQDTKLRPIEQRTLPTGRARVEVEARLALQPTDVLYGFGERGGLLDRRGRKLTNWTIDPDQGHGRGHDNMYQAHPTFMVLRPGLAWGLFLNSSWYSEFDAGATDWERLAVRTLGGELDLFILTGPTPADVVEQLTRLTGRPMLPPLWALGYHQSRWSYDSADEVVEVARDFRARDIPLDAIHIDIDYMRGYRDFTWDPDRFSDPAAMIHSLRESETRAVTIVDPGVKFDLDPGYPVAREALLEGHVVVNPDGTPYVGYCWPDAALFPDFSREESRHWWGEQHRALLDVGVSGIWNDMNEPAIFDRPFSTGLSAQRPMELDRRHDGDGGADHAEVHNLYGLLMDRATNEGLRRLRPDERPWILTRSGFTGVQSYAVAWMGDNNSWWEHLQLSLPQMMSMGISGVPHTGVDVGGFFDNPSGELYARWVVLGAFYPFMRTHTCTGTGRQEPWSFGPEVEEIARRAIALRYRLLPYLYTLAHEAHRSGAPLFRPLAYDAYTDPATFHLQDQVMIGADLMLSPIVQPGMDRRLVYLPAGRWYRFGDATPIEGAAWVVMKVPLDAIPLWVRGGTVLPLAAPRRSTTTPLTELTVEIYPAAQSEGGWIEDDGISFAYERGESATTRVVVEEEPGTITVRVKARAGAYEPAPRTLTLRLYTATRPDTVRLDGQEIPDWRWNEVAGWVEVTREDLGTALELRLEL